MRGVRIACCARLEMDRHCRSFRAAATGNDGIFTMLWWPVVRLFHPRGGWPAITTIMLCQIGTASRCHFWGPSRSGGICVCINHSLLARPHASRLSSFAIRAEKRKKQGRMSVMGVSSYTEAALAFTCACACAFRLFSHLSPCFVYFWIFFVFLPFLEGD
jgi:hypothetical protein